MKNHKDYNNKVTALKKLTEPLRLKEGETKIFVVNGIKRDKSYPDRILIPASVIVPSTDTIMVEGEPVDIASIKAIGAGDKPIFHTIKFVKQNMGRIRLRGGHPNDQLMYEYMMLCNYNESNPNRDTTKRAMFTLVDDVASATTRRASRMLTLKAQNIAMELTDEEVHTFAGASGWVVNDINITRDEIEQLATKDPEGFMKFVSNRKNNIKADIADAIRKGIITYDKNKSVMYWTANEELITNIPRTTKGNHLDSFASFLVNTEVGQSVYDEIKQNLGSKKEEPLETVSPNPSKLNKSTKK